MVSEKKAGEPIVITDDDVTLEKLEKTINEFIMKYQMDIETLNKILSMYEDEISSLKNLIHDLSYKLKTLQTTQPITKEE